MSRAFLGLVVGLSGIVLAMPAVAADYAAHPRHQYTEIEDRGPNPYCGPRCGCPEVTLVRHRQLVQYYPSGFDPRERDEPRYAYGAVRTYARFEPQNYP